LPDELESLKKWLSENRWTVTDIVMRTQRRKDTALDADLIIIEWNVDVIQNIFLANQIENIFFTSQWVERKFDKFIKQHLETKQFESIKQKILLSPSRNGLRRAKDAKFTELKCDEGETAEQYRKRYYSTILNLNATAKTA